MQEVILTRELQMFTFERIVSEKYGKHTILLKRRQLIKEEYAILKFKTKIESNYMKDEIIPAINKVKLNVYCKNTVYHTVGIILPGNNKRIHRGIFICPISPNHVPFYTFVNFKCEETLEHYWSVVDKCIPSLPKCDWIINILNGTVEQENVVFRDNDPELGFVLVKKTYGRGQKEKIKTFTAYVNRRDLRSLRDLTSNEILLLENVLAKSREELNKLGGIKATNATIHYHPTYWHLHIHFTGAKKATYYYQVEYVIEKLKEKSNFFATATLNAICKIPNSIKEPVLKSIDDAKRLTNNGESNVNEKLKECNVEKNVGQIFSKWIFILFRKAMHLCKTWRKNNGQEFNGIVYFLFFPIALIVFSTLILFISF